MKQLWYIGVGIFFFACSHTPLQKTSLENMVKIPSGKFPMGTQIENDRHWGDTDEEPVHEVFLDTYLIDRFEVTSKEFSDFLNHHQTDSHKYIELGNAVTIEKVNGTYRSRKGLENYPANRISWFGANTYCQWKGKRLPTEAEWEKAAKGIEQRSFPWGNEFPNNQWVTFRRKFSDYGFQVMEPVDSMEKGKSPYGIHHMAGNVWEWVSDWYAADYYDESPKNNPQGPPSGISKVLRGGNWYFKAYYMRTTYRFNERPDVFKVWQGFRCAKSLK